ncbi:hypothetical protein BUALT_Bualt17G0035900 [Buddleja alternifolia]|uniref:DUF4216 domain-containing protein n=1 Tax=Buddleja alternifolia TaxID=168488 RepID=A0AAV6WC67_9LAMI|nr:hypothetical protein BUALT_Bualt17G0035900 [Buddleja alternifolia]
MFDNVFNTVMDMKGKTKDNVNARLDLQNICKRRHLELKEVNGKYIKPKASYTLTKDERLMVLKWIKNLRLPDGLYDAEKQAQIPNLTYKALGVMHNKEFATWFCNYNPSNQITDKDIKQFSREFSSIVKRWNGYFMNGYRFHTLEYGETRSTMNSGVCINGSYYDDSSINYYGEFLEILELSFFGFGNTVILFKCKWFDTGKHGTKTPLEDFFQETNSDPARIILDNELDDVAILTDVNRQEKEVNPVELQPSRREFEEEFESDELEVGSIDFSEEELQDEESENENNLTSDDSPSGD